MAVDLKKLKEKHEELDTAPLNSVELGYVAEVEKYIDDKILKNYTSDNRNVNIDLAIVDFDYDPIKHLSYNGLTRKRRGVLKEYMLEHYKASGWKFDTYIDDGLDGPNRSGVDYFIFKG